MCFGIRFSSLFHQAIQKVSIQNLNCPKNAFADTIFIPALQSEETGSKFWFRNSSIFPEVASLVDWRTPAFFLWASVALRLLRLPWIKVRSVQFFKSTKLMEFLWKVLCRARPEPISWVQLATIDSSVSISSSSWFGPLSSSSGNAFSWPPDVSMSGCDFLEEAAAFWKTSRWLASLGCTHRLPNPAHDLHGLLHHQFPPFNPHSLTCTL